LRFSGRLSAVQAMPSCTLIFTKSYLYSVIGYSSRLWLRGRTRDAADVLKLAVAVEEHSA
jgi:hypothetical protein